MIYRKIKMCICQCLMITSHLSNNNQFKKFSLFSDKTYMIYL